MIIAKFMVLINWSDWLIPDCNWFHVSMGNSNQSNLENVERIRDKRGWSGYFGVEGKQHVLLRLCTSTPMKTARIRGGGGAAYLSSWPRSAQHGRTQKFCGGGGGGIFYNNVEHCKQIFRTKIERFGAYLGYFSFKWLWNKNTLF